jgi:hypothetical protein
MSETRETSLPAWYDPGKVVLELDVAPLLAAGAHPQAPLTGVHAGAEAPHQEKTHVL